MTALQIAIVIALTGQAVFQTTRVSDVASNGRLRLAIIYAAGVIAGGLSAPAGVSAAADGPAGASSGGGPDA